MTYKVIYHLKKSEGKLLGLLMEKHKVFKTFQEAKQFVASLKASEKTLIGQPVIEV